MIAATAVPDQPRRRRFEWLSEQLLGVKLPEPLICGTCHWRHYRAGLAALRLLADGKAVRCIWCATPMTRKKAK